MYQYIYVVVFDSDLRLNINVMQTFTWLLAHVQEIRL